MKDKFIFSVYVCIRCCYSSPSTMTLARPSSSPSSSRARGGRHSRASQGWSGSTQATLNHRPAGPTVHPLTHSWERAAHPHHRYGAVQPKSQKPHSHKTVQTQLFGKFSSHVKRIILNLINISHQRLTTRSLLQCSQHNGRQVMHSVVNISQLLKDRNITVWGGSLLFSVCVFYAACSLCLFARAKRPHYAHLCYLFHLTAGLDRFLYPMCSSFVSL